MCFWLVGESPNPPTVGRPELWLLPDDSGLPHTANRLLALTGWTIATYLAVFSHRTNVWPDPRRIWLADGRPRAERIVEESAQDGSVGVVVLGSLGAQAFGIDDLEPLTWSGRFASVPHPSGRCRFWNLAENRAAARDFFAGVLERASGAPVHRPRRPA